MAQVIMSKDGVFQLKYSSKRPLFIFFHNGFSFHKSMYVQTDAQFTCIYLLPKSKCDTIQHTKLTNFFD